jgi:uncharacterized protein YqjF (DUF2071 family)
MPRPFLTARWANLAIVSYAVPPAMLTPYLPVAPGGAGSTLEIDTRDDLSPLGGPRAPQAFVSLVAFQFQNCRVLGIPWPGHTDFPEINLRFYVRTGGKGSAGGQRGVVFIREFVPKPMIAWAAKKFYNEPYLAAPITSRITQDTRTITAEYSLSFPVPEGGARSRLGAASGLAHTTPSTRSDTPTHTLRISAQKPVTRPPPTSIEHWFKEHTWGFGMRPPPAGKPNQPARPLVYEVIHPIWGIYPVQSHDIRFDFGAVYGPDWGFLSGSQPVSVVLAAGSEVAVFPPRGEVGVRWSMRR